MSLQYSFHHWLSCSKSLNTSNRTQINKSFLICWPTISLRQWKSPECDQIPRLRYIHDPVEDDHAKQKDVKKKSWCFKSKCQDEGPDQTPRQSHRVFQLHLRTITAIDYQRHQMHRSCFNSIEIVKDGNPWQGKLASVYGVLWHLKPKTKLDIDVYFKQIKDLRCWIKHFYKQSTIPELRRIKALQHCMNFLIRIKKLQLQSSLQP